MKITLLVRRVFRHQVKHPTRVNIYFFSELVKSIPGRNFPLHIVINRVRITKFRPVDVNALRLSDMYF